MNSFSRTLGIDLGTKRIGLAVSDPFGDFAIGLDTLTHRDDETTLVALHTLCQEKNVAHIALGLPKHMNGDEGEMAEKVKAFGTLLAEKTALPIHYIDERLTSKLAENLMIEAGISPSKNKGKIDQGAAIQILQTYLDQQKFKP